MDYQKKIATQVSRIPRSGIRDFFEIVQSKKNVISLGIGEPDYAAPWHIREAAIYSLERGETGYTSNLGMPSLRRAIAEYVGEHLQVSYQHEDEVLVTVGVSQGLDLAFRALLEPGDEVLYHEPCYVSYNPSVAMAYGVGVPVETRGENHFMLRAEDIEKKITPRSRLLVLNFPTNPTGAIMERSELEKIARLAIKHDLLVISDEIYSELVYDELEHVSVASLPEMRERTVLLHGFSKAFAMTGFRLGYACAPAPIIEAMMKIHQYAMLCAPITSQAAALEALQNGAESVARMRESYRQRRNFVVKRLNAMGCPCHMPGGAFYVFPSIASTGLSSRDFAVQLLEQENVAVVPGNTFGASGEGFVRASYATSFELLEQAMDRMEHFVQKI